MDSRQEAFLEDLQAILDKHGAELEVTDNNEPYGMQQGVAIVSISHIDKPYLQFNLPAYMTPTPPQTGDDDEKGI